MNKHLNDCWPLWLTVFAAIGAMFLWEPAIEWIVERDKAERERLFEIAKKDAAERWPIKRTAHEVKLATWR